MGKKVLVVFYSRSGRTAKVADVIKESTAGDVEAIVDKANRKGLFGFMKSGRDAIKGNQTTIEETETDVSMYDVVVIGTPVWAGRMTPAVRTYINRNKVNMKNVAFFSTQGGQSETKAFTGLEELCGKKPVSTLKIERKQILNGEYVNEAKKFSGEILAQ